MDPPYDVGGEGINQDDWSKTKGLTIDNLGGKRRPLMKLLP